ARKVIATTPTSSPANEAHHFGYTVNADRIFAGGLFSNRLFIYDVASDPKHPKLLKTVPDLAASTGYSGPHTFYAVPGGVLIAMLGSKDGGAPGGKEHTSELQSRGHLVCRLLLEKKNKKEINSSMVLPGT